MKRTLLALSLLHCITLFAEEEEMMRMMAEARERIISSLKAAQIPEDITVLAAKLTDGDTPTRDAAVKALLEHSDRKAVINGMILAMRYDDDNRRPNAGTVLVQMSTDAVKPLIDALNKNDQRARAAWCMSQMGEAAKPAIPALIELLKSESPQAVNDAALALGVMGANAKEALLPLIDALKNEDREVRYSIANAIKQIGPSREHIPLLLPAFKDPYMKVRSAVVLTFGYMGEEGKPAIPEMIKMIKDENAWVRMHSSASLARFGADAKNAVPALREALKDEAGIVRGAAANALARIQPSAEIVPDLIRLLQDENERVRTLAEDAIVIIGKPAVDDLKGAAEAGVDSKLKVTLEELITKINTK